MRTRVWLTTGGAMSRACHLGMTLRGAVTPLACFIFAFICMCC